MKNNTKNNARDISFILFYFIMGFLFLVSFFYREGLLAAIYDNAMFVFIFEFFSIVIILPLIFYFNIKNELPESKKHLLKYFSIFLIFGFSFLIFTVFIAAVILFKNFWVFFYLIFSVLIKYHVLNLSSNDRLLKKEVRFFLDSFVSFGISMFLGFLFTIKDFFDINDVFIVWTCFYFLIFPFFHFFSKKFISDEMIVKRNRF